MQVKRSLGYDLARIVEKGQKFLGVLVGLKKDYVVRKNLNNWGLSWGAGLECGEEILQIADTTAGSRL